MHLIQGFIYNALLSAGFHKVKVELLDEEMPNGIRLLKIQLIEGKREVSDFMKEYVKNNVIQSLLL